MKKDRGEGFMGKKNIYIYNNLEFRSIKALSAYTDVAEKTITARLRRGMSVESACQNKDLRCHLYVDGNEEKSITQICKEKNKDVDVVRIEELYLMMPLNLNDRYILGEIIC